MEALRQQLTSASQDSKNLRQELASMTAKSQETAKRLDEEVAEFVQDLEPHTSYKWIRTEMSRDQAVKWIAAARYQSMQNSAL